MERVQTAGQALIGQTVRHRAFGSGIIEELSGNVVTVNFPKGDKKFIYPDAFETFLHLEDQESLDKFNRLMETREKKIEAKREENHRKEETRRRIRAMKIVPNSHTVFALSQQELKESMERGWAFTGKYMSGFSEGRPRTAGRIKPNSLCLLTVLPEGAAENERVLGGLYMAKEDFYGDSCYDGQILAHEKYRLTLPQELNFKIWENVAEDQVPRRFGGMHFRYMSEEAASRILTAVAESLQGEDREKAQELLQYFCKVNRLPYTQKT